MDIKVLGKAGFSCCGEGCYLATTQLPTLFIDSVTPQPHHQKTLLWRMVRHWGR